MTLNYTSYTYILPVDKENLGQTKTKRKVYFHSQVRLSFFSLASCVIGKWVSPSGMVNLFSYPRMVLMSQWPPSARFVNITINFHENLSVCRFNHDPHFLYIYIKISLHMYGFNYQELSLNKSLSNHAVQPDLFFYPKNAFEKLGLTFFKKEIAYFLYLDQVLSKNDLTNTLVVVL